jgi:hypothetical protein
MPTEFKDVFVFTLFILCVMLLLFYYNQEYFTGKNRQGFHQGRNLTFRQGFHQGRNLTFRQGYINKPVLDGKTPQKNDGLREIEASNEYFGMSCASNKENCVSNKWNSDSSIQMNANQRKIEGMGDGDENQWSMDHNNIGLTIDSTLNELQSQDLDAKLKCGDSCPSVSGMNRKWTDTALDEIGSGLGGFEMYGATDAKINN